MPENVHLGKEKKAVWISCHVSKDREAGGQEHKIGELFLQDLSPTVNREVLSRYQNSEENKFFPSSLFSISTFRSSTVFPDQDTAIGFAVPVMGREIATPPSVFLNEAIATPQARRLVLLGAAPWHSRINGESNCMVSSRAKLISRQKVRQCHDCWVFW